NRLVRADVLRWLPEALAGPARYDLIICDPPTFSNSKKMSGFFDVGAQHPQLINQCLKLLERDGILYFSTNFRGFQLNEESLMPCRAEEITAQTVPVDYRNRRIHRCWRISPLPGAGECWETNQ